MQHRDRMRMDRQSVATFIGRHCSVLGAWQLEQRHKVERLFVYGTLVPGGANHHVLKVIPGCWETARLKGNLVDDGWGSELGCPGIIPSDEGEDVGGYVLSSDRLSEHWPRLDEFEGNGYKRVSVMVEVESGERVEAYVYALNHSA